ncbi:Mss4-like protein [Podospora appendiculata]|uniref:Mss4-like protein n=1 Tax=Podospora appendiculata TaxID=314037 RepID=A0AAE0X7L2_9PEZI|nr:Mss4-like protein [Podospora appendiculata]
MADTQDQEVKAYRGNCHCGAFIYEFSMPEIKTANACNCSICTKKGYVWVFPGESLKVVKDKGTLVEYKFNAGNTVHKFCGTCGTAVTAFNATYPAGKQTAVNGRAVQGLDIWKLEINTFEGAKIEPQYEAPVYTGPEPATTALDGGKTYHGSCHCGAVKAALTVSHALDSGDYKGRIAECNCSLCMRGGYIWIYPKKDEIAIEGAENLTKYAAASKSWAKAFCKRCGVHVLNNLNPLTDEEVAALSEPARMRRVGFGDFRPFNLRILNDFDPGSVKPEHLDGWNTIKPMYTNP